MKRETYSRLFHDFAGRDGMQRLSPSAQLLLVAVLVQYNGRNNGALMITGKVLGGRWRSNDLRLRAKNELVREGFLVEMFKGHRPNKASLYAVTCYPLNEHRDHDPADVNAFTVGAWKSRDHNHG